MPDRPALMIELDTYLNLHKSMTLATIGRTGSPWASSVFYAHDEKHKFYFLSENKTRHGRDIAVNPRVAVAINDDPVDWREIKGIQMEGEVAEVKSSPEKAHALAVYLKKFPFVRDFISSPLQALEDIRIAGKAFTASLYVFLPEAMYYLDNRHGFSNRREIPLG